MPRNEDGDYVLEVGNRQLLSVVFVLMVLFGVFFSLGYFVGRNSTPETAAAPAPAAPATPGVAQPRESPLPPPPGTAEPTPADKPASEPAGDSGTPAAPATPEPKPETRPVIEAPKPQAVPAASSSERRPVGSGTGPQPGQIFLQVAAVKRSEAEALADVLKHKGFRTVVVPVVVNGVPSDTVFRTLVGPLKDPAELAKTKAELEKLGFKTPIVRKY